MTAPTSDRAQRAKGIAALSRRCRGAMFSHNGDDLAAAIVAYVDTLAPDTERLGGGEREAQAPARDGRIVAWEEVCKTLSDVAPGWVYRHGHDSPHAAMHEIRTLAQTAKDATARAEAAERANVEVDNARKSAEQSARDLRAENARLRAQLDAMTGEQKPWAYDVKGWGIFRCKDEQTLEKELQHAAKMTYRTDFQPIPLYRHPSPAARVVGACVVRDGDVCGIWCANHWGDQRAKERKAWESARRDGGTPHRLHCSVDEIAPALTPTTDGAQ